MMEILKKVKREVVHTLLYWGWGLGARKTPQDFYAESVVSIAARWEGEVDPVLTYTAMYDVLRQRKFSGSFWELGGGYSTILAPLSLRIPMSTIHSVDFNPDKYNRILNSTSNKRNFLKQINLYSEITVSYQQVEESLLEMAKRLTQYPLEDVLRAVGLFSGDSFASCNDKAQFKEQVLNSFREHPHAHDEKAFYDFFDAQCGEKLCSRLVRSQTRMDVLFLDCGELSSIAEFILLEPLVPVGGYILLHDIFYPKSIKNYLVATLLVLSDQWDVVYTDTVSAQGGLVAVRRDVV